jgi:hypothetical protein
MTITEYRKYRMEDPGIISGDFIRCNLKKAHCKLTLL